MDIIVSAFVTCKADEKLAKCEDSCAVNLQNKSFAISDGVTQSFYSRIWSGILTKKYVENPSGFIGSGRTKEDYHNEFESEFQSVYNGLNSFQQRLTKASREKCSFSAATFVGFQIVNNTINVNYLGDSVLFSYSKLTNETKFYCSMTEDGKLAFDNSPEYFASNKDKDHGFAQSCSFRLEDGYVLAMTDAIADWFYQYPNKLEAINKLKSLKNHNDFQLFVDALRQKRELKDDDVTILILDITNSAIPGVSLKEQFIDGNVIIGKTAVPNENLSSIETSTTEKEVNPVTVVTPNKLQNVKVPSLDEERYSKLAFDIKDVQSKIVALSNKVNEFKSEPKASPIDENTITNRILAILKSELPSLIAGKLKDLESLYNSLKFQVDNWVSRPSQPVIVPNKETEQKVDSIKNELSTLKDEVCKLSTKLVSLANKPQTETSVVSSLDIQTMQNKLNSIDVLKNDINKLSCKLNSLEILVVDQQKESNAKMVELEKKLKKFDDFLKLGFWGRLFYNG